MHNALMLLSDRIYKRIPQFWFLIGVLFLILGMSAGAEVSFFPAYLVLGILCIARSIWIYQARWRYHTKNQLSIMRSTTIIDHKKLHGPKNS
jgi:hypothetical protein